MNFVKMLSPLLLKILVEKMLLTDQAIIKENQQSFQSYLPMFGRVYLFIIEVTVTKVNNFYDQSKIANCHFRENLIL